MFTRATAPLLLVSSLMASAAFAAPAGRAVELRWDFRADSPKEFEVWVDCNRTATQDVYTCDNAHKIKAPASYGFRLKRGDQVTLVVIFAKSGDPGTASAAITGTNLDEKDLDALKKLFGASSGGAAARPAGGGDTLSETVPEPLANVVAVTDALIAGGKLTATFSLKHTEGGKETISKTSGPLTLNVEPEHPKATISFGLGFSTTPNPSVVIEKTPTVVTFQKDGKTQTAYQQIVRLADNDKEFQPIQSLMTFANFHLNRDIYASVGVQVNQKIFESPIVGLTYRHKMGDRRGLNFTAGVQFTRELKIDEASGWADKQIIDPTLGVTVSDIQTTKAPHVRPAAALTIDF